MKGFETPETNPFLTTHYHGHWMGAVSVADRLHRVSSMTAEELRKARQVPDLQVTVLKAIQRRLRALDREAHAANPHGSSLRDISRRA